MTRKLYHEAVSDYGVRQSPSQIRVLGKSMFVFAAGWILSVGWLWVAGFQQHVWRKGAPPPDYGAPILILGVVPSIAIALCGVAITRWTGRAPERELERREWWHAFWWAVVPNWLLLTTVWVMINESR